MFIRVRALRLPTWTKITQRYDLIVSVNKCHFGCNALYGRQNLTLTNRVFERQVRKKLNSAWDEPEMVALRAGLIDEVCL